MVPAHVDIIFLLLVVNTTCFMLILVLVIILLVIILIIGRPPSAAAIAAEHIGQRRHRQKCRGSLCVSRLDSLNGQLQYVGGRGGRCQMRGRGGREQERR